MKTCQAIVKTAEGGNACGKPAAFVVTFKDGDTAAVCSECVYELQHIAESHGGTSKDDIPVLRVEKL